MATKIAVLSQKGGTGKTTAVRTLTDVMRLAGLKVLAVDLDPQGNLSDYFDVDPEADPTIGDVLAGRASAKQAVHDDLMPANLTLAEAELTLAGKMGRELTLRKALKKVEDPYDVVMIDCPPALGLLTVNALVAADYALLSSEAQYFALQGVEQALEVIELARDGLNPDLEWLGVFFNIADMRTVHSREAFDSLREHVGDRLFDQTIRPSIAYAGSAGYTVFNTLVYMSGITAAIPYGFSALAQITWRLRDNRSLRTPRFVRDVTVAVVALIFSVLFIWYSRNTGGSRWQEYLPFVFAGIAFLLGIPVYLAQRAHLTQPPPVPAYPARPTQRGE